MKHQMNESKTANIHEKTVETLMEKVRRADDLISFFKLIGPGFEEKLRRDPVILVTLITFAEALARSATALPISFRLLKRVIRAEVLSI